MSRRRGGSEFHHLRDVSRRSIRQLVDRCDDDPAHSIHVARLAVALFDAIPELRALGPSARDFLEAGAMLANVGLVVAHSQHHLHAYYVIRNSELAGLTDNEIEVIAQIARYHRKSEPKQSHEPFAALSADDQRLVRSLAAVLRVAIGLDRRHDGRVAAACAPSSTIRARSSSRPCAADGGDVDLEVFAADERSALLGRVLEPRRRGRRRPGGELAAGCGDRRRRRGRRRLGGRRWRRRRWPAASAAGVWATVGAGVRGGVCCGAVRCDRRRRRVVDVVVVV